MGQEKEFRAFSKEEAEYLRRHNGVRFLVGVGAMIMITVIVLMCVYWGSIVGGHGEGSPHLAVSMVFSFGAISFIYGLVIERDIRRGRRDRFTSVPHF